MNATERTAVENFIVRSCHLDQLEGDCNIFETGLANSLFAIQLMTFIENEFSVKVTTGDLDLSNFASLDAIERFVQQKRA